MKWVLRDTLMADKDELVSGIQWESHLVQDMDLRETPLLRLQVDNFRVHHREIILVQKLELR